ncbi:hypothetical protein ABI59_05255 [Acidobacteria bacterium Mor1]|nr:hypothetical protein ABI59_05255 [Acidobacteria bacterium Mor1]
MGYNPHGEQATSPDRRPALLLGALRASVLNSLGAHLAGQIVGPLRWVGLAVVAAVTALLCGPALNVELDWSNRSMNALSADEGAFYRDFQSTFGSDEVLVATLTRNDLLSSPGLAELDRLTRHIEQFDGVRRVMSLTNATRLAAGDYGAEERPLVDLERPVDTASIEGFLQGSPWSSMLISADRRTAGIAVEIHERQGDDLYRGRLVEDLRGLKRGAEPGSAIHLTGITAQKYDTTRFIQRDQRVVLPLSILVMAFCLAVATRRISGVLLPLAVTGISLLWTVGIYHLLGFKLNVITSLLPPVVLVLSVTTGLHLLQEWRDRAVDAASPREAVLEVLRRLGMPVLLTGITTAIGLAALGTSDVPAVRQFGLFAALGVTVSLFLNLTVLPAVLVWIPLPRSAPRSVGLIVSGLIQVANWSVTRPRGVMLLAAAGTLLLAAGIGRIHNNTDLIRFLSPDAELVKDTMFIDERLVGANSLELVVSRRDAAPLTALDDMNRIERWMERIGELEPVTHVLGIPAVIAELHRAESGAETTALPDDPEDLLYCFDLLEASDRQAELRRFITPEFDRARINVRLHAIGTHEATGVLEQIERLSGEILGAGYTVHPTGSFYLVTLDSNRLVSTQLRSFGLALAVILGIMGLWFRSLTLLAAALIPNLVPIVWLLGLMGWLGIDLSTATAMVASVVLGIAVDGTIHYLARYCRESSCGCSASAIRQTTRGTGRVLVTASLVIALGFWVGASGSFRPTLYFSVLSGATILGALLCDLLILPACLMLVRPEPRS